jgi:hypothetical protein
MLTISQRNGGGLAPDAYDSLQELAELTPAQVRTIVASKSRVPWVQGAVREKSTVMGLIHLDFDARKWPAILVKVERDRVDPITPARTMWVAVYQDYVTREWGTFEQVRNGPPNSQYRGDREGEPSLFNGERPGQWSPSAGVEGAANQGGTASPNHAERSPSRRDAAPSSPSQHAA